ncbi:MAG TPA: AraC family transcriptional regulator [Tepidisphaeraceae bacterium]|jgi:AraC-like DNA-binding protein|nr:AraC family transcriptional regulator [Tepidisphaeraceae bacterium]
MESPKPLPYPSRAFLLKNGANSPIGRVAWAGFDDDATGQLNRQMRPYGAYALVYVLLGTGEYVDARDRRVMLKPGSLILTFPDVARRYGNRQTLTGWREFYIVFDGPIFDLWRQRGMLDDTNPVRQLEPINYWVRRLKQVALQKGEGQRQVLDRVCALQTLLSEIHDYDRQQSLGKDDRAWLARAYELLDRIDLKERPDYSPLLEALDLSYAGFRSRFTRLSGQSPGRYLADVQIRAACDLLEKTPRKLRQVARECGFTDEFHLSRRFKQLVGLTPRDFRKRAHRND